MDFYFDSDDNRVLTSHFLQKRGHCCRSSCLHCPYGHTLNTIGLEFKNYKNEKALLNEALRDNGYNLEQNFVNDLLSEALNEKTKEVDLFELIDEGIHLIYLKEIYCGFMSKQTKKLFLKLQFKYQGITEQAVLDQLAQ